MAILSFTRGKFFLLLATLTLAACGGGNGGGTPASSTPPLAPIKITGTPNPNVFPLLLAMARNPQLPVSLLPVADSAGIDTAFNTGGADALLSMTYTAAQKVTSGKIPGLQLISVNLWRGFWGVSPTAQAITRFAQLAGKGIIVSGPTSGGKGGGPDMIFQAAVTRAGFTPSQFSICYLPVLEGAAMMAQQTLMSSNAKCDPTFNMPASAISLVEPAATGLVLQTLLPATPGAPPATPLGKAIDFQALFAGYTAWPSTQLPHGGLSVLKVVSDDPARAAALTQVRTAYTAAVDEINLALTNPVQLAQISSIISAGITTYYGQYGLTLPAPVIGAALLQKELVFRSDLTTAAVLNDLSLFVNEVTKAVVPATFYR
jgi:hypothetical protein